MNKADRKETPAEMYVLLAPSFLLVGVIEVVSIAFRPVSLSFRLFGNVFGGENLLTSMTGLAPYIVPIPFYFYEVLVGVVQALIFTLLVAIYIGLMTNHDEEAHYISKSFQRSGPCLNPWTTQKTLNTKLTNPYYVRYPRRNYSSDSRSSSRYCSAYPHWPLRSEGL